jgi:ubiquinone/menaquinone biosynthesis C-methylase UbiE
VDDHQNTPGKFSSQEEKPEYGMYFGYASVLIALCVGFIGIYLIINGAVFSGVQNWILIISGLALVFLFLWPGVGLLASHLAVRREEALSFSFLREFNHPLQILDCGCGTGRRSIQIAKAMPEGSKLTGIDIYDSDSISVNSLERIQRNAKLEGVEDITEFRYGSILEIPFDDDSFNLVTCTGVLHEFKSKTLREKALDEISRVLKLGGLFYMSELSRKHLFPYLGVFAFVFHNQGYWKPVVIKHGFSLKESSPKEFGFYFIFIKTSDS